VSSECLSPLLSAINYKDTPYDGLPSSPSRASTPFSTRDDEQDTDIDEIVYSVVSDSPDDDESDESDTAPEKPEESAEAELSM
jgi:hypothetical protein